MPPCLPWTRPPGRRSVARMPVGCPSAEGVQARVGEGVAGGRRCIPGSARAVSGARRPRPGSLDRRSASTRHALPPGRRQADQRRQGDSSSWPPPCRLCRKGRAAPASLSEVAYRRGGGLGRALAPRCDHAGPDQRVEPGRAVYAEVSQVHDGLHELLGPSPRPRVQQRRPLARSDPRLPEDTSRQQHRELLVDAIWQAVDQVSASSARRE